MRQSIPTAALHRSDGCLPEEQWKEGPGFWLALLTRWLFEQAGITTGMRILEVGSSAGAVALLLAEVVGPTGSIVSVELHPALLEPAQERTRAAGLTNVSWSAGVSSVLAGEQTFDAVVGRNCLLYLSDLPAIVGQCLEHLRPGGVVVFQEVDRSVSRQLAHLLALPALSEQSLFCMTGRQEAAQFEEHALRPHYFMAGVSARKIFSKEQQSWE